MGCALNFAWVSEKTSVWEADHVAQIGAATNCAIPLIVDPVPILPGYDLWDMWPVQLANGSIAKFDGTTLWMLLSAPIAADPGDRHAVARIRFMAEREGVWLDCGNAMPDDFSPGSREWAGSSVFAPEASVLTLYFTAAGRRGEVESSFEQRIFEASAKVTFQGGKATLTDWVTLQECFVSDNDHYVHVNQTEGIPGHIKAFRDPAFFRDPLDGEEYLLFTGSLKRSDHAFNGAVGIARKVAGEWNLLPPLISADSLNNELERPHIIVKNGLYYLFWSTQRRVFAPDGVDGPNGLYGMVASSLFGPYVPINGTGLVAANPDEEPLQAYSWWVVDTLDVVSFVDHWGLEHRTFESHPELIRAQFGGMPAPRFRLKLSGDRVTIDRDALQ
jgi:levansucrase